MSDDPFQDSLDALEHRDANAEYHGWQPRHEHEVTEVRRQYQSAWTTVHCSCGWAAGRATREEAEQAWQAHKQEGT
jgi:hypothetical protein